MGKLLCAIGLILICGCKGSIFDPDVINKISRLQGEHTFQILREASQRRSEDDRESSRSYLNIEKAIQNKELKLGMPLMEIYEAHGKPSDINKTVGAWGVHEQWVYTKWLNSHPSNRIYIYFEDGVLTAWQN